jgi:hypothetical protein
MPAIDPLNIEYWYPILKDYTFHTVFLDITQPQASALMAKQDLKYNPFIHDQHLETVAQNINDLVSNTHPSGHNGLFVRLSTRSPKDASLKNTSTVEQLLRRQIKKNKYANENQQTRMLVHAFHKALRVQNGTQAVGIITCSKRSYHDLLIRILQTDKNEEFNMKLAIRDWVKIKPGMEFRGFCTNGQLNALSVYFVACYNEEIKKNKDKLLAQMQTLFQEVAPLLTHIPEYVIDFALQADGKMAIVELNHFAKTTGAGLFNWKTDEALLRGEKEFDFRIIEEPVPNSASNLYEPLRVILKKVQVEEGVTRNSILCRTNILYFVVVLVLLIAIAVLNYK